MAALVLAGCHAPSRAGRPTPDPTPTVTAGCGPVAYADVVGRPPSYLRPPLTCFAVDAAVRRAVWLPDLDAYMTPQSVAVRGGTAWVAGYDGTKPVGERYCRLERISLATGRLERHTTDLRGRVGDRDEEQCHHGGGLTIDSHGLWLSEARRLWLLDPTTFGVRRIWALDSPVSGSFLVLDGHERIGVGRFKGRHPTRVFFFDEAALLASPEVELAPSDAASVHRAPRQAQGAVSGPSGLSFATSTTRCGVLVGPGGRRAFVPGAEGLAPAGRNRVWVVSESGSREYHDLGGRPTIPSLLLVDTNRIGSWPRPDCST